MQAGTPNARSIGVDSYFARFFLDRRSLRLSEDERLPRFDTSGVPLALTGFFRAAARLFLRWGDFLCAERSPELSPAVRATGSLNVNRRSDCSEGTSRHNPSHCPSAPFFHDARTSESPGAPMWCPE